MSALSINQALTNLQAEMAESSRDLTARTGELAAAEGREERLQEVSADLEKSAVLRTRDLEQRTRELEAANRDLESFSYSVSHDLRAPLRAIRGFAEILARRHRVSLDEQGAHYLDNIVRASANMAMLIDDLLQYSRLGRSALTLRDTNIGDLVDQILRNLSPRISESGARIHILPGLPTVRGDPTLLGQIFSNLVENALIYHRPGVTPEITVSSALAAAGWTFSVTDNGIGIPAEQYAKIFQPFQRLHTYDEYPGTGIGLALVMKAAQMLGGTVHVDSFLGKGTTFTFVLPLASAPEAGRDQSGLKETNHE
jgi:light-regulated signal transduction histidine kinase (bacteriophytochrome)